MATGTVLYERKHSERGTSSEDNSSATDDVWDDRALIAAYDDAAYYINCRVAARMISQGDPRISVEQPYQNYISPPTANKKSKKKNKKGKVQWEVGAPCRAVFSEDGCEYEATVQSIDQANGTCIIKYIGYNNVEEVPTTSLKPSQGATVRQFQLHQTVENIELESATESEAEGPVDNGATLEETLPGGAMWTQPPRFVSYSNRSVGPNVRQQFPNSQFRMNIPIPPPPPPHLIAQFPDEDSESLSAMLLSWYMSGFHTGYYQGLREAKNGKHNQNPNRIASRNK